jgi:hypothetical protein
LAQEGLQVWAVAELVAGFLVLVAVWTPVLRLQLGLLLCRFPAAVGIVVARRFGLHRVVLLHLLYLLLQALLWPLSVLRHLPPGHQTQGLQALRRDP